MKKPIRKTIITQAAIFFGYLIFSSLLLFNRSGGGDIAFAGAIGISIVLHILILFIQIVRSVVKKDRIPPYVELFTVILLANIFILFSSYYLEMMWWLTNR